MKNLVMIISASQQQDVADQLRESSEIGGFTFTPVEGHGSQSSTDPFLSTYDKVVGYMPRIRVDILLEEQSLKKVLDTVSLSHQGSAYHGIYWVLDVSEYGRL